MILDNLSKPILAGSFVTSRLRISKDTGIEQSKIERILKCFESEQQIKQQGYSKYRIISICNWSKFQENKQEFEQQMNSKRTASEQQMNTDKNDKNDKHDKKKTKEFMSDQDFISALKSNPAFKNINIDRELSLMDAWFLTPKGNGRKKTKRFILNWLSKIDVPIITQNDDLSEIEERIRRKEAERDARSNDAMVQGTV
jgi:hypothetical protein